MSKNGTLGVEPVGCPIPRVFRTGGGPAQAGGGYDSEERNTALCNPP